MDFISYLKKVYKELKSTGKDMQGETEKAISDYIDSISQNIYGASNNELAKQAREETEHLYKEQKQLLEDESKSESNALTNQRNYDLSDYQNMLDQLTESLNNAKERITADAVKGGVARSSIKTELEKEADKEASGKREDIYNAIQKKNDDYDQRLEELEQKYKNAQNSLNYEYAKTLDKRISELKAERDASLEVRAKKSADVYFYAESLLSSMPPSQALKIVADNEKLKKALTPQDYYKLYKKYAG